MLREFIHWHAVRQKAARLTVYCSQNPTHSLTTARRSGRRAGRAHSPRRRDDRVNPVGLPELAHRVISLLRSNLVASGVKRTSITEPDL
jgi:hypothetical protein